jgi:transposase
MNYAQIILETEGELQKLENQQKLVQLQKRVRFLRVLKSGEVKTQEKAGAKVGWKLRYSQNIWKLYREGGIQAVLRKPKRWGFGKLSSQEIARLQKYLSEFGAADLAEVRRICEEQFNVCYTIGGASALCARLKIKLKTARPSNVKKDAAAAETYKKTSAS